MKLKWKSPEPAPYLLVRKSSSFVDEIHAEGLSSPAETLELSVTAGDLSDLMKTGKMLMVALLVWRWLHPVVLLLLTC